LIRDQAEKIRILTEQVYSNVHDICLSMVARKISELERTQYLTALFPRTRHQELNDERPERWQRIEHILGDNKITPTETRWTLWALYNAVTRDEDYRR